MVALAAALGAGLDEFTGGPGAVGPSTDASGALSPGSPASSSSQSGALGIPTALDAAAPLPVAQPGAAPTASTGPTGRQHRSPAPTTKPGQASASSSHVNAASSAPAAPTSPARPSASKTASAPPTKPAPTTPAPPSPSPGADYAAQVVALVNVQRAQHGCKALRDDARIARAAYGHSQDMAVNNYFAHNTPSGVTPWTRMKQAGYAYPAAENIARGFPTPQSVVDAWMNSPEHRANILNCSYHAVGVGYYNGPAAVDDGPWWTQDFGFR